jgi:hypothetical protein
VLSWHGYWVLMKGGSLELAVKHLVGSICDLDIHAHLDPQSWVGLVYLSRVLVFTQCSMIMTVRQGRSGGPNLLYHCIIHHHFHRVLWRWQHLSPEFENYNSILKRKKEAQIGWVTCPKSLDGEWLKIVCCLYGFLPSLLEGSLQCLWKPDFCYCFFREHWCWSKLLLG